jgi:UDP-GlcNAc:undecaprenyl-phosphate/decaprenyl-phosphate GlcNAc-1-phosphate transferase
MNTLWFVYAAFAGVISFLITYYLVPIMSAVAHKLNILDVPDGQLKQHKKATPYLGGVAVYVGFITALALTFPFENKMFLMFIGSTLLLFIGLIDDLIALKPYQKFFGQMVAAFCFLRGGFYLKELFLFSNESPYMIFFWLFISFGWILSVINAFNLIDVMDGLATTTAMCVTTTFLLLALLFQLPSLVLLLCAFLGSLIAFLRFNYPPASIYLGDAGSLFIGGFLGIMPFLFPWSSYQVLGCFTPIVVLLIPLLEVGTLIIIRTYRGIPFYQGSPHHFSIYLRRKGWTVQQVLGFVVAFSIALIPVACIFSFGKMSLSALFLSILSLIVAWYVVVLS